MGLILIEYNHIFEIFYKVIVAVIWKKYSETLLCLNWFAFACEVGNVFSHITLKKGVGDFLDLVWFFFLHPSKV